MPYVSRERRAFPAALVDKYLDEMPDATVGDLNYFISRLVHRWIRREGLGYTNLNAIDGMLDCARAEFYRTVVAPYEDKKKAQNGPVSDLDG